MMMERSKVYFTNFRTQAFGDGLPTKLKKMIKKAGIGDIDMDGKFVAVKMHFGELGNLSFLRPNYARAVVDVVKEFGGVPFLTDCNTLYPGSRKNAIEHLYCAWENGFTPMTVGCPIIIGDGLKGTDDIEVPVEGGEYIDKAKIGRAVMDADMQDPPSLLPQMLEILRTGEYDSVATRRVDRAGEPPLRSWFARQFYKLINRISDADIVDGARDFRLMRREMVDAILSMSEYNRFSKGIFGWVGFRTYWLPYENVERVAGQTKWSFWKLFKYAVDGIINFSQTPLSAMFWFGMGMVAISILVLIFLVVRRAVFGDPVAGWASTICVIIFIGGMQTFFLGVMGQYIAKTYMETKHRPHYIVSETNVEEPQKIR